MCFLSFWTSNLHIVLGKRSPKIQDLNLTFISDLMKTSSSCYGGKNSMQNSSKRNHIFNSCTNTKQMLHEPHN